MSQIEVSENDFDADLKSHLSKLISNKDEIHASYRGQKKTTTPLMKALSHASKRQTNHVGSLDVVYTLHSKNHGVFLIIIETKKDNAYMINGKKSSPDMDPNSTKNYAVNGALWYASHIYSEDNAYDKIFALGVTGNINNYHIIPYYVSKGTAIEAPSVVSLKPFTLSNIDDYYGVGLNHEKSKKEITREQLMQQADELNNDIRGLTGTHNDDKAPLVASILLAMFYVHKRGRKLLDELPSDTGKNNDGEIILGDVTSLLDERVNNGTMEEDEEKAVTDAFSFLLDDSSLYNPSPKLSGNHSPLWKFTSDLATDFGYIKNGTDEDVLGDFYSQFVRYANNDGKGLGIVLTPSRITKLMTNFIHIDSNDYVLDPVAGSGTFLVSAMNKMLHNTNNDDMKKDIRKNHLMGIERDHHIYSIVVSNMILRGDGNSNIIRGNMFKYGLKVNNNILFRNKYTNAYIKSKHPITKILMNPPYSQGKKNKSEAEIYFIKHALQLLHKNGELSAIVPISVVVSGGSGVKKKPFIEWKKWILDHCRVESIITMNPNTFYPTGTQTVIINIKKIYDTIPNNKKGKGQNGYPVKLVNYSNDGYHVVPKHGMQPNGTQTDKWNRLFKELKSNKDNQYIRHVNLVYPHYAQVPKINKNGQVMKYKSGKRKGKTKTKKILKDTCWLFNANYTNPNHPTDDEFKNTVADYLAFKANMKFHGKGYLFENTGDNND